MDTTRAIESYHIPCSAGTSEVLASPVVEVGVFKKVDKIKEAKGVQGHLSWVYGPKVENANEVVRLVGWKKKSAKPEDVTQEEGDGSKSHHVVFKRFIK